MHCFSSVKALLCAWVRYLAHSNIFIGLGATQHFGLSWTVRSSAFFSFLYGMKCVFTWVHLGGSFLKVPWVQGKLIDV